METVNFLINFAIMNISIGLIKNVNLFILILLFLGLFLLSIHFLATIESFKLRFMCYLSLFLDSFIVTLIFTELFLVNDYILVYKVRILSRSVLGFSSIYEPVYTYGFTFITTITVLIQTYMYYIHRSSHEYLPSYFKIDKNVKFFIFSLLFYDIYFIFNFLIDLFIEPNFNLLFEHFISSAINYIFLIISLLNIVYFIYYAVHQPYLFVYLGIKKDLFKRGFMGYYLASMTLNGPETIKISEEFKILNKIESNILSELALHTISSIGIFQESIYKGNMIIPFPDREKDLIAFTFSTYLKNKELESDERYLAGVPIIYALVMPSDLLKSLSKVGDLYTNFVEYLKEENIYQIQQLTCERLLNLSKFLLQYF